jgi:uncharacterized protein YecE (DUF72 family)
LGKIYIGISGWRYPPWRGVFYPKGLAQHRELAYASRALSSVEINGSFYSLQDPASYLAWHDATPDDFLFAVKANRYITHFLRLTNVEKPLSNILASGIFNLKQKLGPILWQFPQNFTFRPDLLEHFLSILPQDTEQALRLAWKRESRMHGRSRLAIDRNRPLRHAMEIRSASFVDETFVRLLRRYNVGLVVADTAGTWPLLEDVTADFVYIRLHGEEELYASGYTDKSLERWAARIRAWSMGSEPADGRRVSSAPPAPLASRDVYCYFDNDRKVYAPFDARRLIGKLGLDAGLIPIAWHGGPRERQPLDPLRPYPLFARAEDR